MIVPCRPDRNPGRGRPGEKAPSWAPGGPPAQSRPRAAGPGSPKRLGRTARGRPSGPGSPKRLDEKMFDGSFKAARNINLGGATARRGRSELLQSTQLERQARALERQRLAGATLIQSVWRGRRAAVRVRRVALARAAARLRAVAQTPGPLGDDLVGTVVAAIRAFVFGFTGVAARDALGLVPEVCGVLVRSTTSGPALAAVSSPALVLVVTRIAAASLDLPEVPPDALVEFLACAANAPLLARGMALDALTMTQIAALMAKSEPLRRQAERLALQLCQTAPEAAGPSLLGLVGFAGQISPALQPQWAAALSFAALPAVELWCSGAAAAVVSCNLVTLHVPLLAAAVGDPETPAKIDLLVDTATRLLGMLPTPSPLGLQTAHGSDASSSSDHVGDCELVPAGTAVSGAEALCERQALTVVSEAQNVFLASQLLLRVIALQPRRRRAILRALLAGTAGRPALVGRLWAALTNGNHEKSVLDQLKDSAAPGDAPDGAAEAIIATLARIKETAPGGWSALALLFELQTLALLTLGDDELFDATSPETKRDLGTAAAGLALVAAAARNVVFALVWRNPNALAETLKTAATSLVWHLHERDARRPLVAAAASRAAFWTMVDPSHVDPHIDAFVAASTPAAAAATGKIGSLLESAPFLVPFEARVRVFRAFIAHDREVLGVNHGFLTAAEAQANIRRGHVFSDGFTHLNAIGARLKGRVVIKFIDQMGLPEAGIDGGGVFKEFLNSLSREAFDPDRGLFAETRAQELYPSPAQYAAQSDQLEHLAFLGRILGKALYQGVLVNLRFAGFFLKKCLGRRSHVDDLPSLDPELYDGLIKLRRFRGNVADLCLTFALTEREFGATRQVELVPGGAALPVTAENRLQYIFQCANYKLNQQIGAQCHAFFRGLRDLVDPRWLRLFDQHELGVLLSGVAGPLDLADLRASTKYAGGYEDDHPVVAWFWAALAAMDDAEQRLFLRFVTSTERAPLLGFQQLRPSFAIHRVPDASRLPTVSTCVNLLKLPEYCDYATLADRLRYAIHAEAGFDLS